MADCDQLGPHHGEPGEDPNPIRGTRLVMQGAEDVENVFRSQLTDIFSAELNSRTKGAKHIQPPPDFLSRVPIALEAYNKILHYKNELIFRKMGRMKRRAKSIIEKHSLSKEDVPRLIDHAEALKMSETGSYVQTLDDPDPRLAKAALELRKRYYDVVWKDVTGTDPQLYAVFKREGMDATAKNLREVRRLMRGGTPEKWTSPVHYAIASEAKERNLVDLHPSYDVTPNYVDGYFTLIPIHNEHAVLEHEIASITAQIDSGMMTSEKGLQLHTLLQQKKLRLDQLTKETEERMGRDYPKMESLTKRHFSEYYNEFKKKVKDDLHDEAPVAAPFDIVTDLDEIFERHLSNSYNKRFFDKALFEVRGVTTPLGPGTPALIKDPDVRNYFVTWLNAMRGVRGFQEDKYIVDLVNSARRRFGKPENFTQGNLRNIVSETMKLQAIFKLFINPRFSVVNSLQTLMTVYPLVGAKAYGRALAETLSPVMDVMRNGDFGMYDLAHALYKEPDAIYGFLAKKSSAWRRAKAAGILDEADRFMIEGEVQNVRGVENILKAFPSFTEMVNRVVAYNAGVNHIIDGNAAIPILKTLYVPAGNKSLRRLAHAHGDAMVKATQFMFGTEGRSLGFVGGSARRLTTQFKSFSIAYGTLMKDTLRLGRKTGEWGPFMRMAGTLWLAGGVPAIAGPMVFYDDVRKWMVRNTGFELPNTSGVTSILERVGLGFMSPVDITGSIEPYSLPRKPSEILPFMAGPTFGGMLKIGEKASEYGPFSKETAETAIGSISPLFAGIGRTARTQSEGGVYSRSGELVAEPSGSFQLAEAMGLRPPTKVTRGDVLKDMEEALVGGHMDLFDRFKERGEDMGLVFGPKTMAALKGRVSRRVKEGGKSFFDQLFR